MEIATGCDTLVFALNISIPQRSHMIDFTVPWQDCIAQSTDAHSIALNLKAVLEAVLFGNVEWIQRKLDELNVTTRMCRQLCEHAELITLAQQLLDGRIDDGICEVDFYIGNTYTTFSAYRSLTMQCAPLPPK